MIINYSQEELDMLARIMRAEALSEGNLGMLLVGNVVVNRALEDCFIFKNITNITEVINQPNQFSGVNSSLYQAKATTAEKNLAKKILKGEYFEPASNALWFKSKKNSCDKTWYNQQFAGDYKNHCFYNPDFNICKKLH